MQKLNKNGLFVKRVVGNDFSVGNTVVEGGGASEDLAILNLTKEQMDILSYIVNSEGRNIPIDESGKIETEIGHTYVITAMETDITVTDADFNELCKVPAHTQMGFVAPATAAYVDNVTCTVTEVFRAAAPIMLSGNGSGESGGEGGLPAGYKRVEYLLYTKTQYVDTGIAAAFNIGAQAIYSRMQAWYQSEFNNDSHNTHILSSGKQGQSTDNHSFVLPMPRYDGTCFNASFGAWGLRDVVVPQLNTAYNVALNFKNSQQAQIDGNIVGEFDCSSLNNPCENSLKIGAFVTNTSWGNPYPAYNLNGKIWEAKISKGSDIIRDFIPCLDQSGAPCFYDLVTQKPFYNSGTGDFVYPVDSTNYTLRQVLPEWGQLTEYGLRRLYHAPAGWRGELIDYALENGFKRIVETEQPADGHWTPQWTETYDKIVLEWIETEPPTDLED